MTKSPSVPKSKKPNANKVSIVLHGQTYVVACGAGEEKKLAELVAFVNDKLDEIAASAPSATEMRLFMLTCLLLADELVETRRAVTQSRKEDENLMVAAVDHLRDRITSIAGMIDKT